VVTDVMLLPAEYVERRANLAKLKEYASSFKGLEPKAVPGVTWVRDAPLHVQSK
jgi:hypothetical protein